VTGKSRNKARSRTNEGRSTPRNSFFLHIPYPSPRKTALSRTKEEGIWEIKEEGIHIIQSCVE